MIEFSPPRWAKNPHVQTIVSPLTRKAWRPLPSQIWTFQSDDGVELIGRFSPGVRKDELVLVYHGLAGSENAPYVWGVTQAFVRGGFSVLRMRLRGAESEPPWSPHLYHAGLIQDISPVVKACKDRGYTKIYLVGFSLSGNTILKWLGEGRKPIEKAFVVSPPVRLQTCADLIDHPSNRIYQRYFLKKLQKTLDQKTIAHPEIFTSLLQNETFTTLQRFDDQVTARFHGFQGVKDYYEKSSSVHVLQDIQNRVAIIHSLDDPFLDSKDLQELKQQNKKNIDLVLFKNGGHVGFFEGFRKGYAVDRWAVEYFQ